MTLNATVDEMKDEALLDDDRIIIEAIEFDHIEDDEAIEPDVQPSNLIANIETSDQIEKIAESAASETTLPQPQKRKNICLICNKTFAQPKNLARHRLIHLKNKTKETDFQCTVCGWFFAFINKNSNKHHIFT